MFILRRPSWKVFLVASAGLALIACRNSPQAKEADFLARGQKLFEKQDYARALIEYQNAARSVKTDAEPYYRIGLAQLAMGNLRMGVAALRKATELNPKHDPAQLKLAELQASTRDKSLVEDASSRLREIVKASPENTRASDVLALTEWKLGNTEDASKRLEETLQKFPSNLSSSVILAKVKLSQKDLAGAEEVLQKAVASAPNSPDAVLALAEFHFLARKPEVAETELRRAVELDPKNARALLGLAAIQFAGKRLDEAEQTYRRISALGKEYKPIHALFLYRIGKQDAALQELKKLTGDDPKDSMALRRVIAACFGMKRLDEAASLLAAALKRNPKDTEALFLRSELNLQTGKLAEAQRDLQQVLHFRPDSAEAHFALAMTYPAQGMDQTRRQELARAIELKPTLVDARIALARNYTLANQPKSALEVLDKTPPSQRSLPAVAIERNWALLQAGDLQQVDTNLKTALASRTEPALYLQEAVLKLRQKDYAGSRASAEEVLKANPEDLAAARLIAESYAAQNQTPKAVERLSQLAKARPNSAALQHLLGVWQVNAGNTRAARQAFEAAMTADPNFTPAQILLADLDRRENRPEAARQRLNQILAKDPKSVPALMLLAEMEAGAGEREAAVAHYRTVLDIDANNLFALNNAAYTLAFDNPDEALQLAQRAAQIAPDNAAVQDTLGWVYYRKGIYRSAIDYLSAAVKKEPTPKRQFHLAMSYIRSGDGSTGQKILQTALRQDPKLPATERGW